jgi:hypothetical protein
MSSITRGTEVWALHGDKQWRPGTVTAVRADGFALVDFGHDVRLSCCWQPLFMRLPQFDTFFFFFLRL